MTDTTTTIQPQPAPTSNPAAVFGRHAKSGFQHVEYSEALPTLRPNYFDFTFGMGAAWFMLLAFAAFIFMSQYRKIISVLYYMFNFKKYLRLKHTQQTISAFLFACFALASLSLLSANLWHTASAAMHLGLAFLWSFAGLLLYFVLKYFLCFIVEVISQQRMLTLNLLTAGTNVFFALCFLLIPMFFIQTMVSANYVQYIIHAQAIAAAIFLVLYFFKTMMIFVSNRISLFFWLLYFTAIEIFPLAAAYKMLIGF